MGFLDLFRREKAITGTPAVLEALNARQLTTYLALGGTNLAARDRIGSAYVAVQNASYGWIYRYTPSIRRTVDYIARNVAQLGLKVYERVSDDEREHRGDHPGAEALRNPNPQTPGQHFIFQLVADKLIYDNAYALKFRADNGTLVLVGIPPHLVGLVGRSHFSVEAYRIWTLDGHSFDVAPEDIIHWRGYNPDDPRKGESLLETLREEIAADTASRQATTELHRSGLALPGWIERPLEAPDWGEEGATRFMEQWANLAKAGKRRTPVLEEGMEFKQGGVTPEDAEMIAGRVWNQDLVSSLYGMKHVPPEGEEERKQFYADVLPPITEILAAFLDLHVLVNEYGADDHYFEFNLDEKRMSDDRIKTLTSAAGAPIMLRDEARAHLNLPALPDGQGQEIVTPLNVTEGGKPSPQVMPIQDPNKPPQDGSHRTEDAPVPAGRSLNGNGYHRGGLIGGSRSDLVPVTKAPLVPRRRRASERRDRWAGEYQGVLERHFDRQRQSLKSKRAQTKAITDDRWNNELGNGLNDVAERQFEAEGKHVAFRLASTFDPDYGQNWLTAKSLGAAAAINLITQQHADEGGLDDAFDQAKGRVAGAAMAYATDIAAFSTKVAAEQAPGEPTVTIDGGECEVCAPFQGSWPMGEIEQWPAYHANCNCVADVMSAAPEKALQGEVRAISPQSTPTINMQPHFHLQVPEGAIKSTVNIDPAEVNVSSPDIHVAPAEVTIEEGAFTAPNVTVEAAQPADINITQPDIKVEPAVVNFAKGAIHTPVTVEAPPPADVTIAEGAMQAEVKIEKGAVSAPIVNVEAPPPADVTIEEGAMQVSVESPAAPDINVEPSNVNVEVKGGSMKRKVTFSDGRTAEIDEKSETKRKVTFSDGRTAEIEEKEDES